MSNTKTIDQLNVMTEVKNTLDSHFKEYEPEFMKLVAMFTKNRIVVTEDMCKEIAQISLRVFNIGFRAGVEIGMDKYEEGLSKTFIGKLLGVKPKENNTENKETTK